MKTLLHATVTAWETSATGNSSPDIKGIGRKKFPFGVFMADSGVEHDPRWQNVTSRPFENSRIDEAVSNFCTRDQTSRTSYAGCRIYTRTRVCARPCVVRASVSIDKTRQSEKPRGHKGDWTRDTRVNRICPTYWYTNIRLLLRYAASGISNPAVLLLCARASSLAGESRVPENCCSVEAPVWWNSDSAERPAYTRYWRLFLSRCMSEDCARTRAREAWKRNCDRCCGNSMYVGNL